MTVPKAFLIMTAMFFSISVFAQNGKILKDPGLKKLSVFAGTWRSQNDEAYKDNSFAVYTCRWSAYGNFLICDQIVTKKDGKTNNLAIYSYDSLNNYKLTLVGIPGVNPFSIPVTSKSDTLIYSGEYTDNGKKVYTRTLNVFLNDAKYKYTVQSSKDGINWATLVEGTAIKIAKL